MKKRKARHRKGRGSSSSHGGVSRKWPITLAVLFSTLLVLYMIYTGEIVRSREADAETFTRVYAQVQRGLTSQEPGAELAALTNLQGLLVELGVPFVVTSEPGGDYNTSVNLPFSVSDPPTPDDVERILAYAEELDARNAPVGDPASQLVHYGITPEAARLRWMPVLWATGLLLTLLLAVTVFRYQRRTAAEQAWTAMARELAHQLGTPISSLQGWVEVLGLDPGQRPGRMPQVEIANAIGEDLVRLERVSRRFELIGRDPELRRVSLQDVVAELRAYMEVRLPRLGPGVALHVDVPQDLPDVKGHEVLLTWALENVVKNALDAMAGTGGAITISARASEARWVLLRIRDTGPGVPFEIRDRLFDPGVTTKSGGWGVGLTLTRRIVEGVHGGRVEFLDRGDRGVTFQARLPQAVEA
ncbi:MAG: HAMP domain-containing histidine kinase [Gemmatimonadetes bacterium]|nr:HAMP domain-containing sensor histidine kinase [Gemmatimonadota bacterium]MXV95511.1 HAMP domain-containing histidine kinase [Gemmatimonadota bacterium]MYB05879.1 HAMP domain-containing histidine kinase [Gemmatimonadota bacterium]MYE16290.1 HAMP domain-containing histidine kinase [Gemmatimonadota bacterium]MYG23975.1 HAMP domain-containing histidine kinase [Gemmatimonadota bacterium]